MSIEIRGWAVYRQKFLRRRGIVNGHKNAHAQNTILGNDGPSYKVKNSCFLVDWSCRIPFKEDSLREGEWVCN